jgi:ATP-binding cassette subfamily C (CFTR/MRP) protein 1
VPSAAIGLVGSIAVFIIAIFEHSRTIRPSSILSVYLLASIIADAVVLRTLLLRGYFLPLSVLTSVTLGTKLLYLILESCPKTSSLISSKTIYGPEECSGIFSQSLFWWLNPLFIRGYGSILRLTDLFALDQSAQSSRLQERALNSWDKRELLEHPKKQSAYIF